MGRGGAERDPRVRRAGSRVLVRPRTPRRWRLRQVRRAYRRCFRSGASSCLANFIYRRLVSGAGGERPRHLPGPLPHGWTTDRPDPRLHCCLQVQKFLVGLGRNLPPLSVMDRTWPPAPYKFLANANQELRNIFYRWKVGAEGDGGALAGTLSPSVPAAGGGLQQPRIAPSLGSARSTGSS